MGCRMAALALLHDAKVEGAHEDYGHALAGDLLARGEHLAGRRVVAADQATAPRAQELASSPSTNPDKSLPAAAICPGAAQRRERIVISCSKKTGLDAAKS